MFAHSSKRLVSKLRKSCKPTQCRVKHCWMVGNIYLCMILFVGKLFIVGKAMGICTLLISLRFYFHRFGSIFICVNCIGLMEWYVICFQSLHIDSRIWLSLHLVFFCWNNGDQSCIKILMNYTYSSYILFQYNRIHIKEGA